MVLYFTVFLIVFVLSFFLVFCAICLLSPILEWSLREIHCVDVKLFHCKNDGEPLVLCMAMTIEVEGERESEKELI